MNGVTLLMRKEFLYLFKNMKYNWIMSLILIAVFCIFIPNLSFVTVIIAPYVLLYGIMAHEEQNHSDALNYILPVSREDICISRYAIGLIYCIITALVVSLILGTGLVIDESYNHLFNELGIINIFGLLVGAALIYTAFIIPIIYKFGCIKMRMVMWVIYVLGFAVSGALMGILKAVMPEVSKGYEIMSIQGVASGISIGLLGIVIYIISYYISLNLLKKKEVM